MSMTVSYAYIDDRTSRRGKEDQNGIQVISNMRFLTWASTDKLNHGIPGCNLGDWDGSNNPSVSLDYLRCLSVGSIIRCIWGGGRASDGS
jgi:hypothetical protein